MERWGDKERGVSWIGEFEMEKQEGRCRWTGLDGEARTRGQGFVSEGDEFAGGVWCGRGVVGVDGATVSAPKSPRPLPPVQLRLSLVAPIFPASLRDTIKADVKGASMAL
jgi:hypothetical protein